MKRLSVRTVLERLLESNGKFFVVAGISLLALALGATAGSLTPSAAPAATMNSLADIYNTIAGVFDSSAITASSSGSLMGNLKYIEDQLGWASASNNLYYLGSGNVGIGDSTPEVKFEVVGVASASSVYASAGTYALPSFTFGSDTNTGIFRKAADSLSISSGGLERLNLTSTTASISNALYISSVGSVGVGTATPSAQFMVRGKVPTTHAVTLASGGSTPNAAVLHGDYFYYVTAAPPTLRILDISSPTAPSSVGSIALGGSVISGISAQGRYIYVPENTADRLAIYDVTKPSAPFLAGSVFVFSPTDVAVEGQYAYVLTGTQFIIMDISNPTSPANVGAVSSGITNGLSVVVQGEYAYVADSGADQLHVFSVSNRASPRLVSSLAAGGNVSSGLAVRGRYVYLGMASGPHLRIIDIINPAAPVQVGSLTAAPVKSIDIQGDYVYMGNSSGFDVADVRVPTAPVLVGSLNASSQTNQVSVQGRYAYAIHTVTDLIGVYDLGGAYLQQLEAGGIQTTDLAVRGGARFAGYLDVAGGGHFSGPLSVAGTFGVYSSTSAIFNILSGGRVGVGISAPTSQLHVVGDTSTLFTVASGSTSRFSVLENGRIGIGTASPLTRLEVQGTASASHLLSIGGLQVAGGASVSYSRFGTATTGHSLSATSDLLLASLFEVDGGAFLDANASVSGTLELTNDGTLDLLKLTESDSTKTYGMVVRDGDFFIRAPSISDAFSSHYALASVASNSLGWTIGTPASPVSKGVYDTSGTAYGVHVSGKYAYVGDGTSGLAIIDISNPASPSLEAVYDTPGDARSVVISGKYAYVADNTAGLLIIDISNPTSPFLVGSYDTPGNAVAAVISQKYAYVADGLAGGLQIIDISNPFNPKLAGSYNTAGEAMDIAIFGSYVYVADYSSNLLIFDISNPSAPQLIKSHGVSGQIFNVSVSGKFAYAGTSAAGIQIIDVSNPRAPATLGALITPDARAIHVAGRYAYVADVSSGLQVVDIGNPLAPTFVGGVSTPGGAVGIYVSGRYAYVADLSSGLRIIDIGGVENHALYAGNIGTSGMTVYDDIDVGNNVYVRNGLGVGSGGILVNGPLAMSASLSSNIASVSRSDLLRIVHSKGYLGGDALRIDLANGTSQENFTGNFARFTLANSMRIALESSGAILASGASQFGAAGIPSSVSYSRFGTAATGHALSAPSDLLLSGILEVDGQVFLDASASISSNLDITGTASASKLFVGLSGTQTTNAVCHPTAGISTSQELVDCDPTAGDYMELYPMDQSIQEGEVVMPDPSRFVISTEQDRIPVLIRASDRSQALGIVSVASKASDFNSVGHNIRPEDNPLPVALNGRVKVRISMENGPIAVGDPLMLSSTPGTAAKATTAGFILGTALDSASADGSVMVFVNPTYWAPELPIADAPSEPDGLFASILAWFRDRLGITFGEGRVRADRVESEQLCVGTVCVTEEQFMKVFGTSTPAPEPSEAPAETPAVQDESPTTEDITPEPVPEQAAETPVPVESVAPEPASEEAQPTVETVPEQATTPSEPISEPLQ